jgi:hypothetical protein
MILKHTLLCGLLTLACPMVHAIELSFIRGPLENTGVDLDASGTVRSQFKNDYAKMFAELSGLTPDAVYQFTVDGISEAEFTADADGSAVVEFLLEPGASQFALDFDPRGKLLAVNDGTADVLSMVYSGPEEPTELTVDERTSLVATEGFSGRVEARYLDQKNKSRLILHLLGLDRGTYTLRIGGEDKAEIDLSKGRSALITFEMNTRALKAKSNGNGNGHGKGNGNTNGNGKGKSGKKNQRLDLDFDPRGELIELLAGDVVAFSGEMLAQIDSLPQSTEETVVLASSGVDVDATGSVVVADNGVGTVSLSLEVDQLPAGSYTVVIGGLERGTISVTDNGAGVTHGELVFSTEPTGTELLLDFVYSGQLLEVKQVDTVFLSGMLP